MSGRLLVIILRIASVVSRLLLVIVLARYLSPAEFSIFSLMSIAVGYSVLVLGFDIYSIVQQKLSNSSDNVEIIQKHFSTIAFLQFIGFCFYLMFSADLPRYVFYVCILVIFEHWSQEYCRYILFKRKNTAVAVISFLRTGLWSFVCCFLVFYEFVASIEQVTYIWLVGSALALLVSFLTFMSYYPERAEVSIRYINFRQFLGGAFPLFVSGVIFKSFVVLDRTVFELYFASEVAASYMFYATILAAVLSFYDISVVGYHYQRLVVSYGNRDLSDFRAQFGSFLRGTVVFSIVGVLAFVVGGYLAAKIVDLAIYQEFFSVGWHLAISIPIYCLTLMLYNVVYAMRLNRSIFRCHLLSAVFALFGFYFVLLYGHFSEIVFVLYLSIAPYALLFSSFGFVLYRNRFSLVDEIISNRKSL